RIARPSANSVNSIPKHGTNSYLSRSRGMSSLAYNYTKFNWEDALNLDSQLTEDEKIMRDAAHNYCQDKLMPRVLMGNRNESKCVMATDVLLRETDKLDTMGLCRDTQDAGY
ncbi:hypothetical protein SARC_14508, partial [Sphaeroforma arctica JP610]